MVDHEGDTQAFGKNKIAREEKKQVEGKETLSSETALMG